MSTKPDGFSFTSLSSFFTHIETNQSVGGAKTGVPDEIQPRAAIITQC